MKAITCSARAPVGIPIALDDEEACGAHQCAWRFLETPRRVGGKTWPTHGYTVKEEPGVPRQAQEFGFFCMWLNS